MGIAVVGVFSIFGILIAVNVDKLTDGEKQPSTSTTMTTTVNNENIDDIPIVDDDEIITTTTSSKVEEDITTKNDTTKTTKSTKSTTKEKDSTKKTTTKKTTTKKTTTKKKTTTTVKTEIVTDEQVTYKYGVKVTTKKEYEVSTYSDGKQEKKLLKTKITYDKSKFAASTEELKSEATSLASKNKSVYNDVLSYVNKYRSEVSRDSLKMNSQLNLIATIRALEMAWSGKFVHARPDGKDWITAVTDMGYSYMTAGENIAYGYKTAKQVSEGWKNSEGHYQNMIHVNFKQIGIGMAELDGKKYWVQIFSD